MTSAEMHVSNVLRQAINSNPFPDLLRLADDDCNVPRCKDKISSLFKYNVRADCLAHYPEPDT